MISASSRQVDPGADWATHEGEARHADDAAFAAAWPGSEFVQQAAAQLPWFHLGPTLLDKLSSWEQRDWYLAQAVEHGWARAISRLVSPSISSAGLPARLETELPSIDQLERELDEPTATIKSRD